MIDESFKTRPSQDSNKSKVPFMVLLFVRKQVSILSVSILAPPLPPLINACNPIPVPLNIVNANQRGTID